MTLVALILIICESELQKHVMYRNSFQHATREQPQTDIETKNHLPSVQID